MNNLTDDANWAFELVLLLTSLCVLWVNLLTDEIISCFGAFRQLFHIFLVLSPTDTLNRVVLQSRCDSPKDWCTHSLSLVNKIISPKALPPPEANAHQTECSCLFLIPETLSDFFLSGSSGIRKNSWVLSSQRITLLHIQSCTWHSLATQIGQSVTWVVRRWTFVPVNCMRCSRPENEKVDEKRWRDSRFGRGSTYQSCGAGGLK